MIKKFSFDYDKENDSLFIYNSKSKSKASVEFDNLIIDFNSKKELSSIELLNATSFLKNVVEEKKSIELEKITSCELDLKYNNNTIIIKLFLYLKSKKKIVTPLIIPNVNEPSPALAKT